ncbi:uncharacterized protein METZ01_LOCUS418377, partial [marine metagenome]
DSLYFPRGDNAYSVMVGTSGWNLNDVFTTRNRAGFFDAWGGTNFPGTTTHVHGIQTRHNSSAHYGWQLAGQYSQDGKLFVRGVNNGSFYAWRNVWTSSSDGSGSGLDADLLDGIQASQFLRSDAGDTCSQRISFSNCNTNNHDTMATSTGSQGAFEVYNNGAGNDAFFAFHAGGDYATYFGLDADNNSISVGGWSTGAYKYKIWHLGNDGSGSGLDADLIDGLHLSQLDSRYLSSSTGWQNASNLNSGTVATASLGSGTANSSTYLRGDGTWA